MNVLSKSEYLSSRSGLSYRGRTEVTFLDLVVVNSYSFVSTQKMTSDFLVLDYLRTLFQLGRIGRMRRKCGKNCVQVNSGELDGHIILCTILGFGKSPV